MTIEEKAKALKPGVKVKYYSWISNNGNRMSTPKYATIQTEPFQVSGVWVVGLDNGLSRCRLTHIELIPARKPLPSITLEDALQVANADYVAFSNPKHKWVLEDRTEEVREPCKVLRSDKNLYSMWFFHDRIDIDHEESSMGIHQLAVDCKVECYVAAYNLGYAIPQFDNLKLD